MIALNISFKGKWKGGLLFFNSLAHDIGFHPTKDPLEWHDVSRSDVLRRHVCEYVHREHVCLCVRVRVQRVCAAACDMLLCGGYVCKACVSG